MSIASSAIIMRLLFLAAQGSEDFNFIYEVGLLAKPHESDDLVTDEEKWLRVATSLSLVGNKQLLISYNGIQLTLVLL